MPLLDSGEADLLSDFFPFNSLHLVVLLQLLVDSVNEMICMLKIFNSQLFSSMLCRVLCKILQHFLELKTLLCFIILSLEKLVCFDHHKGVVDDFVHLDGAF